MKVADMEELRKVWVKSLTDINDETPASTWALDTVLDFLDKQGFAVVSRGPTEEMVSKARYEDSTWAPGVSWMHVRTILKCAIIRGNLLQPEDQAMAVKCDHIWRQIHLGEHEGKYRCHSCHMMDFEFKSEGAPPPMQPPVSEDASDD